ncbi:CoA transferase [Roseospira marina]|uniref:CoA transferase n=1 Tax=Roseospira marina TaxID=140057 RepID=A0A5M6IDX5_9PROT|nr:CaiB/BaiF CoA-transferase family protein [Roseospira marina]KAA5606167.1 CoA transferase [Roseospira marina]MBB4314307.1 crotonobetainyl-CoA:carnitine CoA-transferase CaiB-like acyl-CoA transferase [Roseospira marina]MBB5087467.1 crotonobetainyl-CoA:carnitine CoA-transferase CaiB-like acyl-CoA transferase [Roseospira marina]
MSLTDRPTESAPQSPLEAPTAPPTGPLAGPLAGLRVLDLSRVLAGPFCTQLLGDLGADILKVERPGTGDDTRAWGPPFLTDRDGQPTRESAYYASINRNKRSLAVDITRPQGQALIRQLAAQSDILVENFKVGGLAKYGLAYDDLKEACPGLIYCSITGFGQTGPYAPRAGYDYLAQGMGGMMSLTGPPDGDPVKVGNANADQMTGMYAAVAILAALHHRTATGEGQHIDANLLDSQIAWLTYQAQNWLVSGEAPKRHGNAHPNIVPYDTFPAADGHLILAVGNDGQFRRFCAVAGRPDLATDPRFVTNADRIAHREALTAILRPLIATRPRDAWLADLEAVGVPSGPVNSIPDVFADPHVQARGMTVDMARPDSDTPLTLIANPLRLSKTPPSYRRPPPGIGRDTAAILDELGLTEAEQTALIDGGVVA